MTPETAPYPLTITLAIIAWLLTTTIDEVLKTPYLVYTIDNNATKSDGSVNTTIEIANITEDKAYKNVTIAVLVHPPDAIDLKKPLGVRAHLPSWEGEKAPTVNEDSFEHTFPIIQPGGSFDMIFTHKNTDAKTMQVQMKSAAGADTINLTEPNIRTILVEYHIFLYISLVVMSFIGLYIYVRYVIRSQTK